MDVRIAALSLCIAIAIASPHPHDAMITPRAVLPRAIRTLGWHGVTTNSDGSTLSSTLWRAFTYNDRENPIGTIDSYWADWCPDQSTWCDIPTSCAGGSLYFTSTASRRPRRCDGKDYKCNTDYLFESFGAQSATLTKIDCVISTWQARSYYITSPEASGTPSITSTPTTETSAEQTTSPSLTPIPPPPSEDSGSNVGAIAGGVVGGVAGLAAIALLAFFLIRRRRKREAAGELPASNSLTGSYAPEKAPVYAHEANNNGGVVQEADSRPYEPVPSAPVEMQGNPMSPVELPERRL